MKALDMQQLYQNRNISIGGKNRVPILMNSSMLWLEAHLSIFFSFLNRIFKQRGSLSWRDGCEEALASSWIKKYATKPITAYIAGRAPTFQKIPFLKASKNELLLNAGL
ncbi:hypothetical protein ACTFIR_005712 [Dictyostelium discoideum]